MTSADWLAMIVFQIIIILYQGGPLVSDHDNCHVEPLEKNTDKAALETAEAAYLAVYGMGCHRCAMRVRNGLLGLEGVYLAEVFLDQGVAAAAFDPQRVNPEHLIAAVSAAGNDGRHHYSAHLLEQMPAGQALSW